MHFSIYKQYRKSNVQIAKVANENFTVNLTAFHTISLLLKIYLYTKIIF